MRATATWKQAHFSTVMSGSLQLPYTNSNKDGEAGKEVIPSQALTLQHPVGSVWKMFWDLSIPLRRLPSFHLGSSVYMETPVFGDTACRSMCLLNQHMAPNYLPLWY